MSTTISSAGRTEGGSVSTGKGEPVRNSHRLIVTRLDCLATKRITEMPTPTMTAYCMGTSKVSRKVVVITVAWVDPVRHTIRI